MPSQPASVADLARTLKVMADETRLRILGALAERPHNGKELGERLDLTAPTISHHIRKLVDAGLVLAASDAQSQRYRLNSDLLLASKRVPLESGAQPAVEIEGDTDEDSRFRNKVIRDFFDGERLKEIPAQRKRRVIVLQRIMHRFMPDRAYPEREVNDLLRPVHDDVATLRRELVDYGYLQRSRGIYQVSRAGPVRSKQVQQEITGSEQTWLRWLLTEVTDAATATREDGGP